MTTTLARTDSRSDDDALAAGDLCRRRALAAPAAGWRLGILRRRNRRDRRTRALALDPDHRKNDHGRRADPHRRRILARRAPRFRKHNDRAHGLSRTTANRRDIDISMTEA